MSLLAEHYHTIWSMSDDRALIWELLAESGEPLVDLGCATGRVLQFAVERGVSAIGIENDPAMITVLRDKFLPQHADNASLIESDFTTVPITHDAGLITCVGNTFSTILDRKLRLHTLIEARRKLRADGRMLIWILNDTRLPTAGRRHVHTERGLLLYESKITTDTVSRTRTFGLSFQLGTRREEYRFVSRLLSPEDMHEDICQAGLFVRGFFGGFGKEHYDRNSHFQVYVLAKNIEGTPR